MTVGLLSLGTPPVIVGGGTVNFNVSNVDIYMNSAKSLDFTQTSAAVSAALDINQVPQTNIGAGSIQSAMSWADSLNQYSNFVIKYTGNSTIGLNGSVTIFYSINPSGAVAGLTTSGVANGFSFSISATSPRAVCALGDLITATSSNGGWQNFTLSTTGFGNVINSSGAIANAISSLTGNGTTATMVMAAPHGLPTGMTVTASAVAGVTPSGFNSNAGGTVYTVVDSVTISYLNATSGTASIPGTFAIGTRNIAFGNISGLSNTTGIPVYANGSNGITLSGITSGTYTPITTGGPGTQSEARYGVGGVTANLNTSTALSWSGLVVCAASDENALSTTSNQVRQSVINSFSGMSPKYIRFMDVAGGANTTQINFAGRAVTAGFYPANRIIPSYWGGSLTWAAGDQYTTSISPTFSPPSGVYQDGETVQGAVSQLPSAKTPSLQIGTRGYKPIIGFTTFPLTILFGGTITTNDTLSFTFTGTQIAGSPYTKVYTVNVTMGATDTNINALGANIVTWINADSVLAPLNFVANNSGNGQTSLQYNRNGGSGTGGTLNGVTIGGGTSFTFSTSGGATETISSGTIDSYTSTTSFSTALPRTYVYSKPFDAWIMSPGLACGNGTGMPFEVCAEICNRVGCGYWANIPLMYSPAAANSYGALLATTLNSGTPVVVELSNEIWNFGQFQTQQAQGLGTQIGFPNDYNDFYALQFVNLIAGAFVSGYTGAGGSRSNLQLNIADTILEGNGGYSGGMQAHRWEGIHLVTSNAFYAAMGGPGWTSTSTSYNVAPARPIDLADATSYAIYFCGALIQITAGNSFTGGAGQQSFYNTIFQASSDYASGNPTQITSALNAWNTDIISGTRNGVVPGDTTLQWFFQNGGTVQGWQTKVSSYDTQRQSFTAPARSAPINVLLYEGALQQSLGSNAVNGLQTADPTATLAAFTMQGYTLSPTYGASNAVVAQNMVNLFLAYKASQQCHDMVQSSYCGGVVSAHPGRIAIPAWYGYSAPNVWGFYPTNINATPYTTWTGFRDANIP